MTETSLNSSQAIVILIKDYKGQVISTSVKMKKSFCFRRAILDLDFYWYQKFHKHSLGHSHLLLYFENHFICKNHFFHSLCLYFHFLSFNLILFLIRFLHSVFHSLSTPSTLCLLHIPHLFPIPPCLHLDAPTYNPT